MNARDEAIEIITRDRVSSGGDVTWATDLVEAIEQEHAHELAEKIRAEAEADQAWRPKHHAGQLAAADLIDPEARP